MSGFDLAFCLAFCLASCLAFCLTPLDSHSAWASSSFEIGRCVYEYSAGCVRCAKQKRETTSL